MAARQADVAGAEKWSTMMQREGETRDMPTPNSSEEPTLARATPRQWRAWLAHLLDAGMRQVGWAGLLLLLAFGAACLALYGFLVVADEVTEGDTVRLDLAVLTWLQQFSSPALDGIMWGLSALGAEAVLVLLVVLVLALVQRGRWGAATALVLTTVGAQLLNNVLKDFYQRPRPTPVGGLIPAQAFSFPSGHAMVATAFYLFVAYLAWRLLQGWRRMACTAALMVLIGLIGLSRLYLGVHYLTDVVAGVLAGSVWTSAVIVAGRIVGQHLHRVPPAKAGR